MRPRGPARKCCKELVLYSINTQILLWAPGRRLYQGKDVSTGLCIVCNRAKYAPYHGPKCNTCYQAGREQAHPEIAVARKAKQSAQRRSAEYVEQTCACCGQTKRQKQWRKGPKCDVCYAKTPTGRYTRLKATAKYTGQEFSLTLEEYIKLTSSGCSYNCGSELPALGGGIDRIDATQGYIPGNVRACCTACNMTKNGHITAPEYEEIVRLLQRMRGRQDIWAGQQIGRGKA